MRLNTRSRVDLPQPDGPMIAVTRFSGMSRLMFFSAWKSPYRKLRLRTASLGGGTTVTAEAAAMKAGGALNRAVLSVMGDLVAMQVPAGGQTEQQHEQRDQQRAGPGNGVQCRVGIVGVLIDRHWHAFQLIGGGLANTFIAAEGLPVG